MKSVSKKVFVLINFCLLITISYVVAQPAPTTKIIYQVDSGSSTHIKGQSFDISGKLALDETGNDISGMAMHVPLISFKGSGGNYLAKIGGSEKNADMNFISNSVNRKGSSWEIIGELEFNKKFQPVTVNLRRKDVNGKIILTGKFDLNTSKYFIGSESSQVKTEKIPFNFTLVFKEPEEITQGLTLSTDR